MTIRILSLYMFLLLLHGCAGEPVADSPGVCSISCSEAKLAGSRETFRMRLATQDFSFICGDGMFGENQSVALFPYPIPVRFIVESNSDTVPYKSPFASDDEGSDAGGGGGDDSEAASSVEAGWIPVGNISFDVVTSGGTLNPCGTNSENGTVNDACNAETGGLAADRNFSEASVTPYTYAGVVTPKSEWCSDSCGIMSVDIWPVCVKGGLNKVNLSVRSGGVFSNSVSIEITNESADTTTTTFQGQNSDSSPKSDSSPDRLFESELYLQDIERRNRND